MFSRLDPSDVPCSGGSLYAASILFIMMMTEAAHQDSIGDCTYEQHQCIAGDRQGGEVVLAHPARHEWNQRKSEQQVQLSPQNAAADCVHRVHQLRVVVPVNPNVHEAQLLPRSTVCRQCLTCTLGS